MELKTLDFSDVHFPRDEWKWLRSPARLATNLNQSPDAFVWGARIEGEPKLWVWHPKGTALENGFPGMKLRVLQLGNGDLNAVQAHGLFLKTSFQAQAPQDVEWVAALEVLTQRLGWDLSASGLPPFWSEALEASGLEPHLGVLAQRAKYRFLTAEERQFLFDRRWDLSTFDLLESMPNGVRQAFLKALLTWGVSASQAKECANFALILVRKLSEKAAETLLAGPFKSADEFRSGLFRTAQPELSTLMQKRIEMLRGMRVPTRTSVFGDPTFEKDLVKITHTPRNLGDIEDFKNWINDTEVNEKLKALLEIYQS